MSLKKTIGVILLFVLILIIVIMVKTFVYPFGNHQGQEEDIVVGFEVSELSLQRFSGGIRIPTISNEFYEETDFGPFNEFKNYLPQVYPAIYSVMDTLTINNYGLLFRWKGSDPGKNPILFLSHYDVVPVVGHDPSVDISPDVVYDIDKNYSREAISEVQQNWEYPPFSGAIANGRIYGRGTLDMKGMLFSILEAADALIMEGFQPEQDIWFAFGHDEETGGRQGAVKIAGYFKENGIVFDAVYDEGGIIAAPGSALESIARPMALIGLGEKGLLTLRLKVYGLGGHSSMPPAKSSLVYAAELIEKLNNNQMQARIIPPIASFLNQTAGEMGFGSRMVIANQWLMKPILIKSLSKIPASNALVRTTTAISMAKGSDAANVLSSVSEITVNFRILPGDSVEDIVHHVQELCHGYDVQIENISAREASGISPENVKAFEIIGSTVKKMYPDALVTSYITIGGTDAYKYQIVSNNIYRFMPVLLNQYEQRTIHNENEHISIQNFGRMIWYFKEIMKTY